MSDETLRMVEAEQAKAALDRFLTPAFDVIRADYAEKLAEVAAQPLGDRERAAIEKLALAIKVADQVRKQIESLVVEGHLAKHERDRAKQIADIPAIRRKMMGIAV